MRVLRSDKTLFCDVDDTLIIWHDDKPTYTVCKEHVALIKRFHKRNQPVIVWSAGGYAWAEKIVNELGLKPYVTLVMAKPQWFVDDMKGDYILPEATRIHLPTGKK